MWQLYQFPLCPFSRKLRLLMGEKNVAYELVRENPWEGRDEFWHLNPAGRTPVLHDAGRGTALSDSQAICEYLDECYPDPPLLPADDQRVASAACGNSQAGRAVR